MHWRINRGEFLVQNDKGGYEKVAQLYDLFDQKPNIDFFIHYASGVDEVLDIGAGTGRIALPLARHGVKVCCIERSPAMRREFERKLAQQPDLAAKIELVAGEASNFFIDQTFPVAFLSGVFDHFLNDEERIRSLTNIGQYLDEKGILVFDVFLGLMEDSSLSLAGRVKNGNRIYQRFVGSKLLPGNQKETKLIFEVYEDGKLIERIEERSLVGLTSRQQIHQILAEAHFCVTGEWSNYDFTPYQDGDSLLIIEAIKQ
jgi:SAM-dependent methyltransferase